jgi:hypothetical protein
MKNAYLLSLEQQIAEKQQRCAIERAAAVRASAPAALGILGGPSRGGGGEPLRDEEGRVVSGVRGLFQRELLGAKPAAAQRHGEGADTAYCEGRDSRVLQTAGTATGRGGLRDPNAGHHIFGAPAELLCSTYGDRLPPTAARGVSHREPFDPSQLPRPRTESLRPPPDTTRRVPALPWGAQPSGGKGQQGSWREPQKGDLESSWEKRTREYREQATRRLLGQDLQPQHQQRDAASDDAGSVDPHDSFPTGCKAQEGGVTPPRFTACVSAPRTLPPRSSADERRPRLDGYGLAPPPVPAGGVGMYREWVEALVLDRECLRQQLLEAGLEPCC